MSQTLVLATVTDEADYTIRTRLDGVDYNLRFQWNDREARWYLAIFDIDETLIVGGLKLITNWPLLRFYQSNLAVPPGEFYVTDLTNDGSPAGIDELGDGKRCSLIYVSATDL